MTFSYITVVPYDSNYEYLICQSSNSESLVFNYIVNLSISFVNTANLFYYI